MARKPTYEELEKRVKKLEKEAVERKRAEEALKESEERFRTIVETAPSLLTIIDTKGKNIYASPNCKEICGYTQEKLQSEKPWWVHEDDTTRVQKTYDRTFREALEWKNFEYKAVKKNGQVWYVSSSWKALKDSNGIVKGFVVQAIDITERKKNEEALQKAHDELEQRVEERTASKRLCYRTLQSSLMVLRLLSQRLNLSDSAYHADSIKICGILEDCPIFMLKLMTSYRM